MATTTTWTLVARDGLLLARAGQSPEQDWGHMAIRSPDVPAWMRPYALGSYARRGVRTVVLNSVALARVFGWAMLDKLAGRGFANAVRLAGECLDYEERATTFAWPESVPYEAFSPLVET